METNPSMADFLDMTRMNLFHPVITNQMISSSLDRFKVVGAHVGFMETMAVNKLMHNSNTQCPNPQQAAASASAVTHDALPNVQITLDNAVDIKTLSLNIGKVVEGKFLLCRTITPARQMKGIYTIVEDPEGKYGITLSIYNYSTSDPVTTDYDHVIPSGSFLAIKNPWFKASAAGTGVLVLRCDNPSQIEMLSEKAVKQMFPSVKWHGSLPSLSYFPNVNFWSTVSGTERQTAEALKKLGNIGFVQKRFTDAVRWYNLALDYANNDGDFLVDVYTNRAAAFLSIRCFHRALEDTNKVLEKKPTHVKAVYRKTQALIGLEKYKEAADFISAQRKTHEELEENNDLHKLSTKAEIFKSQLISDHFDVHLDFQQLENFQHGQEIPEDIIQFTGAVEKKLLEDGKGFGLIVTADILPGQLLLSSKAFGYTKTNPNESTANVTMIMPFGDKPINHGPNHDKLVAQLAYKIYFEPEESGPEFYSLFAGPELGTLPQDSQASRCVSMKRIDKIIIHNSFRSEDSPDVNIYTFNGLWSLPSLLNHSCCDANTTWLDYGGILIIRALKPIKKGEEVLISYVSPMNSYNRRLEVFRSYSFICQCRLCKLDEADVKSGREKTRAQTMAKLRSLEDKLESNPREALKEAMSYVTKLETMRKASPNLNICLISESVKQVADALSKCGRMEDSLKLNEKMYSVAKECGIPQAPIWRVICILKLHVAAEDIPSIRKWTDILKKDLIAAYGSIKAINLFLFGKEDCLQALKAFGVDFFKD